MPAGGGNLTQLSCHPSSYCSAAAVPFVATTGDAYQSHIVGWRTNSCGSPVTLYDLPPGWAATNPQYSALARAVIFVVQGTVGTDGTIDRSTCANLCGAWTGDVDTSGAAPVLKNVRLVFPEIYDPSAHSFTSIVNADLSADGLVATVSRVTTPGGRSTVLIGNTGTGALAAIPSGGAHDTSPRLSPDANQVSFLRNTSTAGLNRSDVWVAPVTCAGLTTCDLARQLTAKNNVGNNAVRGRICWSPAGDALMFSVFLSSSGNSQIDKVTLSNGQVSAVTSKNQNLVAIDWQP